MGTQGAVVAVGDAVCPTDLAQDEGAGCHGFAGFGVAQVRAAVHLRRQNNNAGSAAGGWKCLICSRPTLILQILKASARGKSGFFKFSLPL